jgi:hypothetical protein
MEHFYFLVKYTPFWAIPVLMICAEFAYIFWLKAYKSVSIVLSMFAAVCIVMLIFYYWSGGPDGSVRHLLEFNK